MMPIPDAPIPDWAIPVPMSPPAIAMPAPIRAAEYSISLRTIVGCSGAAEKRPLYNERPEDSSAPLGRLPGPGPQGAARGGVTYYAPMGVLMDPPMSHELQEISSQLVRDLELKAPPVQVSYLEAPPAGVALHPGGAPSVCTFFAEGQHAAFYSDLKGHEACEVGAFVLGIPPAGEVGGRLMSTIGMMTKEGYLHPGEEAKVPHNATPPKFVAYGPLGSFASPPSTVLLFAPAKSAMMAMEAAPEGPV